MRQLKNVLIGALVVVTMAFGWVAIAHSQSFKTGDNVTLAQNETLDRTLFASGRTLDIAGTVNGDIFCAGQNVTISGTVNGDVMCVGQSVSVAGKVNGDIRVAGQTVTLSGQVSGNASVAGQSLTLDSQAKIGRDLSLASQDATLNGTVGRDLAGASSTLTVNGKVGRDVTAQVQTLTLGSNARVTGNVAYTSDRSLNRSTSAVVLGTVTRTVPKPAAHHVRAGSIIAFSIWMAVYMFAALLLISMVLVLLVPRAFHVAADLARLSLLKTFLVGFAASILVPVILLGLMFTVIGIPLALFGGLVWLVVVLLAGPFAAYLLGRMVLHTSTNNAVWTMLFGSTLLLLLYFIPFLGVITSLVAMWFGLGTILMRVSHLPRPGYRMQPVKLAKK